jgi:chaperone BCS1
MDVAIAAAAPDGMPAPIVPIYKLLFGLLLKKRNINISSITSKALLLASTVLGAKLIWTWVKPIALTMFTSSVEVPQWNNLHSELEAFLAKNTVGLSRRHLRLSSWPMAWHAFRKNERSLQPELMVRSGLFWYQGIPIWFQYGSKMEDKLVNALKQGDWTKGQKAAPGDTEPMEHIKLYTLSVSPSVLLKLLQDLAQDAGGRKPGEEEETTINTPDSLSDDWREVRRAPRPMSTINLEEAVKESLIKDIQQYIAPDRHEFYRLRGIPYRRGFLFHGPPGTGKTSTSVAIAGMLKGELYIVSMNEIRDEHHLKWVFNSPRKGDVLLLEDIDSAGITRENMRTDDGEEKKKKKGISLSSLLNAIDGACGSEGIILIMTSNNPESLDPALVRPGRIDRQVFFGEASHNVAEQIFCRMYQDDKAVAEGKAAHSPQLLDEAKEFAAKIPDRKLTPVEVQTFLTCHQTPKDALAAVDEWVERMLRTKEVGHNIITSSGQDSRHPTEDGTTRATLMRKNGSTTEDIGSSDASREDGSDGSSDDDSEDDRDDSDQAGSYSRSSRWLY